MVPDVEPRITGELACQVVDGCTDHHRQHERIEVGPELARGLEVREQFFKSGHACNIGAGLEVPLAVRASGVQHDLHGRDDVITVLAQESQVGLDVGPSIPAPVDWASIRGRIYAVPLATSSATTSRTSSSLPSKW